MKDAKGHGSESHGGTIIQSGGLKGVNISPNYRSVSRMRPDQDMTDTQRTVADLRSRMSNTGPGHSTGLLQGIRNLLGG